MRNVCFRKKIPFDAASRWLVQSSIWSNYAQNLYSPSVTVDVRNRPRVRQTRKRRVQAFARRRHMTDCGQLALSPTLSSKKLSWRARFVETVRNPRRQDDLAARPKRDLSICDRRSERDYLATVPRVAAPRDRVGSGANWPRGGLLFLRSRCIILLLYG